MATYTTVSTASNDGTAVHAHPDVGAGLGIGVYQTAGYASMAALQTALVGSAWTEIGPEHSADVVCNSSGDTFLISWYRSFPLQRLFAHYVPREEQTSCGGFRKTVLVRKQPRPRYRAWGLRLRGS